MVVLGVTGCIGAYKACEVLRELQKRGRGRARGDDGARHAVRLADDVRGALGHPVFVDQFALGAESDIRHISLADAADLLLVAPATANTIGKFARGIADDALEHAVPGHEGARARGARHERQHVRAPGGAENMAALRARGVGFVEPGSGYLACGWLGKGRLAEVAGHRRRGAGRPGAPPRSLRRPDGRGHARGRPWRTSTPCASSPTARAAAWATAWPRPRATAARASCWSPVPPRCRRRPA